MKRKLTLEQANEIREKYAAGDVTFLTLALEYGVSESSIQQIVKGRTYNHDLQYGFLTVAEVKEIRALAHRNRTTAEIAEKFDLGTSTIRAVMIGTSYKSLNEEVPPIKKKKPRGGR